MVDFCAEYWQELSKQVPALVVLVVLVVMFLRHNKNMQQAYFNMIAKLGNLKKQRQIKVYHPNDDHCCHYDHEEKNERTS